MIWLQNEVTTIAWCWKLTFTDGTIMGFTSHDQDLVISGVTYEAATGFTPTAVETTRDMAVDNLDVEGMIDSENIKKQDILTGRYDGAKIQIFLCNWKNLSDPIYVIRRGTLGQIVMGKQAFTAEIRGLMQAYQQQSGDVYQKTCRATMGDIKCGKNVTSYTFTGHVTAVHDDGTFDTNLTNADKYFDYGLLTFTSGDNNGRSFEIKQYLHDAGWIMTFLPATFPVAVGDTFSCIAGCDGNFSTCKNKFSYIESIEGTGNVPAYRGLAYIVFKDVYTDSFGRRIPNLTFEVEAMSAELNQIISDISIESGLEATDIDTADLEGITINGYSVERTSSGRDKIEPLMLTYLFDGVERDGKIYFRQRHAENALTIPYDDLGAYESERTEPLQITIIDELELPRSVSVKYVSPDFDYQDQSIPSKRQLANGKTESSIDPGLVLTDSQAQELADTKLYEAWINRITYETVLGSKYAETLPGDVLKLTDDLGNIYPCIVTQSSFGKPGLNKISATAITGTIYQRVERVIDASTVLGDGEAATQVYFEFLDLPHLPTDASTTNNIYYAATGNVYNGVNVYKTNDGGSTYDLVSQLSAQSTMGYTITLLSSGIMSGWDNVNTVDVVLLSGSLESRSETDVLNWFNAAVIGDEVIQFATAELINTNTYRLSGLLRGKLDTGNYVSTHTVNDRFILLKTGTIGLLPTTDLGIEKTYRVGPITQSVDDITYTEINFTYSRSVSSNYPFTQITASTIWTIEHNLNKNPSVTCFESDGVETEGVVDYIDLNNLTIKFSAAISGTAYLI